MKNFSLKTKENSLHNSREKSTATYLIWIVVAFFVLFGAKDMTGSIASFFTSPIIIVKHYIETSSATIPFFIRSRFEILDQVRELEEEVASHEGVDAMLGYLTKENMELRAMLGASSTPRIVAGVLSRPPTTPYDTLVIDQGERDGIVQYAPVYHGKGIAIGYVREVFSGTALVTLFSSPEVKSTVYIFGPDIFTTAYGEGGGVVRLSVPQGIRIEAGDPVILPFLDTGTLGTIETIQSTPTEPEQHAYVTIDAPLQSLRLVSVGTHSIAEVDFEKVMQNVDDAGRRLMIQVPKDFEVDMVNKTSSSSNTQGSPSTTTQ